MGLKTLAARLEFYHPSTGDLRATYDTNLRRIEIAEQSRNAADDAGFDFAHTFANLDDFHGGDEVRVYVQTENDADLVHIWTGIVDSVKSERNGPDFADLPLQAQDYVYWFLARRHISDSWKNKTPGEIIRSAVSQAAPEIGTVNVEDTGTTLGFFAARDEPLLGLLQRLSEEAGAEFRGDKDKQLHFFEKKSKASGYSVDSSSVVRDTFHVEESMEGFGNSVIVRGATRTLLDKSNGSTPDAYSTVSDSVREKVKVPVSKSKLAQVELYTDPQTFVGDLRVRLQADDGTGSAPANENDSEFDLATTTLAVDELTVGGWTEFQFPDHIITGGSVWMIVESSSEEQRVGTTAGTVLYRTHIEVPIVVRRQHSGSVRSHGRLELPPLTDQNIRTTADAEVIATALLDEARRPSHIGGYECQDMDLVNVQVGHTVSASFPKDGVPAGTDLVVTGKRHVYDGDDDTYTLVHEFTDARVRLSAAEILASLARRVKRLEDDGPGTDIAIVVAAGDIVSFQDEVSASEVIAGGYVVGADDSRVGFSTMWQEGEESSFGDSFTISCVITAEESSNAVGTARVDFFTVG